MIARLRQACIALTLVCASLVAPAAAQAAFPGANGKIAFQSNVSGQGTNIRVVNPDGTGKVYLTNSPDNEQEPTWSPDGGRIAYLFEGINDAPYGIYVMNANGSEQTRISSERYFQPGSWSPDGSRIVFSCRIDGGSDTDICTMRSDGSDVTQLTFNELFDSDPVWSPDGTEIVYTRSANIHVMSADGTNDVTVGGSYGGHYPDWSPDGKQIAFQSTELHGGSDVFVMDRDGGNRHPVTNDENPDGPPAFSPDGTKLAFWRHGGGGLGVGIWKVNLDGSGLTNVVLGAAREKISWQPLGAFAPYPRPGGGTPLRVPLVPAFEQCSSPNSQHVAPLAQGSCTPPVQGSDLLTTSRVGHGSGFAYLYTLPGNPATSADEADVRIETSISDVRNASDQSDYSGEVLLSSVLRITDRASGFGGVSATVSDFRFDVPVTCTPSAPAPNGSNCQILTTADTLVPGMVAEGKRSVVSTHSFQVLDPGLDGDVTPASGCPPACGTGDERTFLDQGVLVP